MSKKKLIKNAIQCVNCKDVIESKYTHDFKWCKCGTVAVDGGLSYTRRCFKNSLNDFIDLSEYGEVEEEKFDLEPIDDDYDNLIEC